MPVIYSRLDTIRSQTVFRHFDLTWVAKNRSEEESDGAKAMPSYCANRGNALYFLHGSDQPHSPPASFTQSVASGMPAAALRALTTSFFLPPFVIPQNLR
jgi:hypothetical protein